MIVSGVNPKGKPLIIKKCGVSAFGNVYYSPDCAGNILSFGNAVRDYTDVMYTHDNDCYIVGPIPTHKSQEMIKNERKFFYPNSIETDGGEIEMHLNFTLLSAELHILSA
jgi:hypothetical protein